MRPCVLSPRARSFGALAFILLALATFARAAVTNVAWYRLGEDDPGAASGQTIANPTLDVIGTRHLARFGAPVYTGAVSSSAAGRLGSSLAGQFNGTSQYVSNAVVSIETNNFGIEAWVNPDDAALNNRVIAFNGNSVLNGWGFVHSSSGYFGLLAGVAIVGLGPASPGQWTHLALVREGGLTTFYINGVPAGSSSTAAPKAPVGGFAIGARPNSPAEFFDGAVDEARVFTFAAGQFSTNDLLINVHRVATLPADTIGLTNAHLNGSTHALGLLTLYWFEWGTTTNYGNITSVSGSAGGGNVVFGHFLTGLAGDTTHHFRAVVSNRLGVAFGTNQTFRTLGRPMAETLPASALTQTSATLNGVANPGGVSATAWFEWGFSTNYGNLTPPQAIGSGTNDTNFSEAIAGLIPGIAYHFRAVASNSIGIRFGADQSTATGQPDYLKAGDISPFSGFGHLLAMSGDTLVVAGNGAYVFVREGSFWEQQAHLTGFQVISSVAVSGDTLVIGDAGDDNSATNTDAGAAHVFVRSGTTWTRQAILRKSNAVPFEEFGRSVTIAGDTIVVGVPLETHSIVEIPGIPFPPTPPSFGAGTNAGTAYVFVRSGTNWNQQTFLRSDNIVLIGQFGTSVAMADDTIVVGERRGQFTNVINGANVRLFGTVHVFVRNGTNWSQQSTLLPSNPGFGVEEATLFALDEFGASVAISGNTIVVGAPREDSNATGINGSGTNDLTVNSGAAYVFGRSGTNWTQQAYLKASNTGSNDFFGASVAVSGDRIIIGAAGEDSNARNVNGDGANNLAPGAGAAYVFTRQGATWSFQDYLKASNTESNDNFGVSVAVSADLFVVSASGEDSNDVGLNGDEDDNSATNSGAVYIFGPPRLPAPEITVSHSGTNVLSGASLPRVIVAVGNSATRSVTIKNSGSDFLTGLVITFDGPDAAMFSVTVPPVAPLTPTSNTTFTVRFAPTNPGTNAATLHIASNDTDENPFDIQLSGVSLSFTEDRDGDGLNDASELLMSSLGFNFQASQTSLVNTLFNNARGAGLFTAAQIQALSVGTPLLTRDPGTGLFTLTISVEKSTDLTNFLLFPMTDPQTLINTEGKLEFQFSVPDNAAFFRLEAR